MAPAAELLLRDLIALARVVGRHGWVDVKRRARGDGGGFFAPRAVLGRIGPARWFPGEEGPGMDVVVLGVMRRGMS